MMIKVEFECKENDLDEICLILEELAGKCGVSVRPRRAYSNYCGFYRGGEEETEKYNKVLKKLFDKGIVNYYMVGHFNISK